jgi:hypothetical protein
MLEGFSGRYLGLRRLVKLAGNVLTKDASEYSIDDLSGPFHIF